ncbi:MAG: hypothetical protein ABJB76_07900 [Candidatus Nitrosocosmicus sp.]
MTLYKVNAGDDLQSFLDSALAGDIIEIQAGVTFTGNYVLKPKQGTPQKLPPDLPGNPQPYHIVIRSSTSNEPQFPKSGDRVDINLHPEYLPKLVKITSPNHDSALRTDPPTTNANTWAYWLIGIELTVDPSVPPIPGNPNKIASYQIVSFGDVTQTDLQKVPSNLVLDRCYIHGNPGQNVVRGIGLNSADTIITECYLSDFHIQLTTISNAPEAQAIQGQNGPGPYMIVNSYLEAGEINIFFGGGDPKIPGLVPSDIHLFGNYISKPLKWKTTGDPPGYIPGVKNLFELKSAKNVTVEGNIFEYVW